MVAPGWVADVAPGIDFNDGYSHVGNQLGAPARLRGSGPERYADGARKLLPDCGRGIAIGVLPAQAMAAWPDSPQPTLTRSMP